MVVIGIADILRVILITAFAGGTTFLGIWISKKTNFSEDHILALTAFGAGILISAAIFSMVIEAEKSIGIIATLFAFMGGAIVFTIADLIAERKGGGAGILLGIGLDSIPESLAIGAAIASGPYLALSLLIGIQTFNLTNFSTQTFQNNRLSYRVLVCKQYRKWSVLACSECYCAPILVL